MGVGVGGCQVEETDFICATRMGIAALCSSRPAAVWGPSCSEQGGGLGGGERQEWGSEEMGAALGLSAAIGEPDMGSSPRE